VTARHSALVPALPGVLVALIGILDAPSALADPGPVTIRLEEAYQRAEARSPEVRILAVRVEEAEVQVKKAWAILKPQWTASYTFTHLEPGPPAITFPEPLNFNTPAIRDNCVQGANSQMLDGCLAGLVDELNRVANAPPRQLDFARQNTHQFSTRVVWNPLNGSAIPILKNANANVEREAQQRSARIAELRLVVARTYYAALATQEALHAAERAEARAAEELALTQAREELGDRPPLLAEGIRIAATQARIDTRRAKNAHAQALLALALVTFSDDRPDVVWPDALPERPPGSGEALLTRARRRPDVAAALTTVQIAERAESEVWWRFVPTVGVFGGYRLSNVPGITGQRDQWSVGLAATVTLYDGGLRYADLDLARKRRESAQLALEAIRLRAAADVERAELDLEAADLAFDRAEQAVRLARQNLELSRARFEVGALRPAELQAANDGVLDAEIAVARARAERALAILGMRHAVGLDASGVGEDVE
jgi:outer membrane protein TolC